MLVMRAQTDVHAHVVQQRGDLQQQTLAIRQAVLLAAARRTAARRAWRRADRVSRSNRYRCPRASALASTCCSKSSALTRPLGSVTSSSTPALSDAAEMSTWRAAVSESSARYTSSAGASVSASTAGSRKRSTSGIVVQTFDLIAEREKSLARNLANGVRALPFRQSATRQSERRRLSR